MIKRTGKNIRAHVHWTIVILLLLVLLAIPLLPRALAQRNSGMQGRRFQKTLGQSQSQIRLSVSDVTNTHRITVPTGPKFPQLVLYDQYNYGNNVVTPSATFTDFPTFIFDLADDFVVPAGQIWNVQSIDADGMYFNGQGPAASFNVYFNAGIPGPQVYNAKNQPFTVVGNTFTIALPNPAILTERHYWVEVQANMTLGCCGEWGWTNRLVQSNAPAAWQNPGVGSGIRPMWDTRTRCVGDGNAPDQMFRLVGTIEAATPTPACTPNYTFTIFTGDPGVPGMIDIGNHCNDCSTVITLPFPVTLYGNTYTSASAGSNGHLTFGIPYDSHDIACWPTNQGTYVLAPYWTDQITNCAGCGIFTNTFNSAPDRIFFVEYRTQYPGQTTDLLDYEVAFYENGDPPFQYIYHNIVPEHFINDSNLVVGVKLDNVTYTLFGCDVQGGTNPPVSSNHYGNATYLPCPSPTPTATPIATFTPSPTATPTFTPMPIPTATRTPTPTASATHSPTSTPTPTPTRTLRPHPTASPHRTPSPNP